MTTTKEIATKNLYGCDGKIKIEKGKEYYHHSNYDDDNYSETENSEWFYIDWELSNVFDRAEFKKNLGV